MNGYTVAKYIRLSSEDDDLKQTGKKESNSIVNQRNLLDSFISQSSEFSEARVLEFCDDGWSGKTFERPAVQEMLDRVMRNEIQCIIVKDLSRFGRDYLTVGNYISRVFPFKGVRFIAVNDGIDSIRPADVDSLETSFKGLLYDLYSRDLSRKVRSSKLFRAKRGDFASPFAPYGYVKDPENPKRLAIDPDAAETVRRIFQMMADGQAAEQIAKALNHDAVPTPMLHKRAAGCSRTAWTSVLDNNFWTRSTVKSILRDERYIGKNVYGKRTRPTVGDWHTSKVSKSDWIVVDDAHEGIVTREEFDRAHAAMRKYTGHGSSREGRMLCNKVRCGVCGHIMARINAKNPYYRCDTPRVTDAFSCSPQLIPESDLMEAILDGLRVMAATAIEWDQIWKEEREKKRLDISTTRKAVAALKETQAQHEWQLRELYEAFALGEIGKSKYLTAKEAVLRERDDTVEKIDALETELENVGAGGNLENRFVNRFQKYTEVEVITREIVEDVLKEVLVYPEGRLETVWNYREDYEKLLLVEQQRQRNGARSGEST